MVAFQVRWPRVYPSVQALQNERSAERVRLKLLKKEQKTVATGVIRWTEQLRISNLRRQSAFVSRS